MDDKSVLLLTRKKGSTLQIGDSKVVVVDIHKSTVRLLIKASRSIPILRGEAKKKIAS